MRNLDCRIILTEACNMNCEHCFNADVRNAKMMDIDKFLDFAHQNRNDLRRLQLKIMGGEPTIHPRFEEFVERSVPYFDVVRIFTNGTTLPKITRNPFFKQNQNITYTVNGFTFDPSKFDQYKQDIFGLDLHFVIPMVGADNIIQKALNCADFMRGQVAILYSADTQVNVFDRPTMEKYRKVWLSSVLKLIPALREKGISFAPDHTVPACFFTQDMIEALAEIDITDLALGLSCCYCPNLGLIDTDFNLHYCNQTRIKLGSIIRDDGAFKNMDEIREMIAKGPRTKTAAIKQISKMCGECEAVALCRVGCYYNTLIRSSDENCNPKPIS